MSELVQILLCLFLSAFFSGMEIAFISANRLRIELDKRHGLFSSNIINYFIQRPEQYLVTILIGNNIVLVVYSLLMSKILSGNLFWFISSPILLLLIQTTIATLIILITAEFLPKIIFKSAPNFFLNYFIIPVFVFYVILIPIVKFVLWLSQVIIGNRNKSDIFNKQLFGRVDLEHLIEDQGNSQNDLDTPHEIRIFRNALDFSKIKLRDCMVPRTDLAAIEDTATHPKLRQKFIETGFSKIVVYHQNIDNIVGYVNIKDLFKINNRWQTKIIKAPIAPETMLASKMLKILMQEHKSLAVVVDEFGGTAGIVTIEDLMEEIFGEIQDEHDTDEWVEKVLNENSFIFSGRISISVLNDKYNLQIPLSEEYETLAGYIIKQIGKIPSNNETFRISDFTIKILRTYHNRIELVYIKQEDD